MLNLGCLVVFTGGGGADQYDEAGGSGPPRHRPAGVPGGHHWDRQVQAPAGGGRQKVPPDHPHSHLPKFTKDVYPGGKVLPGNWQSCYMTFPTLTAVKAEWQVCLLSILLRFLDMCNRNISHAPLSLNVSPCATGGIHSILQARPVALTVKDCVPDQAGGAERGSAERGEPADLVV